MTKPFRCVCCDNPLEPVQQLRFLVETDNLDNPSYLNRIRALPSVHGRPVPVCKACQAHLESHPVALKPKPRKKVAPLSLLGVFGALSIGVLVGGLFASRG